MVAHEIAHSWTGGAVRFASSPITTAALQAPARCIKNTYHSCSNSTRLAQLASEQQHVLAGLTATAMKGLQRTAGSACLRNVSAALVWPGSASVLLQPSGRLVTVQAHSVQAALG